MLNSSSCLTYSGSNGELNAELFRSSGDCIKIIDLQGRICLLNPGGIVALELSDAEQLLGEVWFDIWPDDSRDLAINAFDIAKNGDVNSFQAFCPTAKGTARWWDVVASPVRDHAGVVKEVMVVSRDVSELFLARRALCEADQRKNEFLAVVAHEFRNPITAAFSASELLKIKAFDHQRTIEVASLIQRQLGHMSRIAEDLLDASRIGRGDIGLKMEHLDMKALVTEAVEQLHPAFTAKRQRVTVTLCDEGCMVSGDHTRLLQVAGNLLGNAVRYTPTTGAIALNLQRTDDLIVLSVIDTGIGIGPERIATIFDAYTQVDKSGTSKSDGLGLGLSLVQAFVHLHGGTVRAASEGITFGSQFVVTLPAVADLTARAI